MIPPWGTPVIVTTKTIQRRKHRKKRINKKWAKRYGFREIEFQNEEIVFFDGKLYVTKNGLEKLKKACVDGQSTKSAERRFTKDAYIANKKEMVRYDFSRTEAGRIPRDPTVLRDQIQELMAGLTDRL